MKTSLTHLLRYLSSRGLARVQIVEDSQREYDPAFDFYRKLREAIVSALYSRNSDCLWELLGTVHKSKQDQYRLCIEQVEAWMSKGTYEVVSALKPLSFQLGDLKINVSPEVLMLVDGKRYVVKMYFSQEQLSPHALRAFGFLVRNTFGKCVGAEPAILDVRHGKLRLTTESSKRRTFQWLIGEAAGFVAMWKGRAA